MTGKFATTRLVNPPLRRHFKCKRCGGGVFKICDLLNSSQTKKWGKTMTAQTIQNDRHPIFDRAQRTKDVLLVSSFGLWAVLIGFSPVLAFRMLTGS
jgi:hypothetical protein